MEVSIKRNRNQTTDGDDLYGDVLELIFKKLSFMDLASSTLVCSNWNSIAKVVQACYSSQEKAPSLLIPPLVSGDNFSLCDIAENRSYNFKTNMGFTYCEESCYHVGSSHGCLIFLDKKLVPFVLNPFTGSRFELPEFTDGEVIFVLNSLDIDFICYEIPSSIRRLIERKSRRQSWLRFGIARKIILSSDPFDGNNFSAVMIFSDQHQLAYYNVGQSAWTHLDPEKKHYADAIFDKNTLYAVEDGTTCVEAWEFRDDHIVKTMKLQPQIPRELSETYRIYLVKLNGRVLLVTRNVGDRMDDDGNRVTDERREISASGPYEEDKSDDEEEEAIGPYHWMRYNKEDNVEEEEEEEDNEDWYIQEPPKKYRALSFNVFELDMVNQQWQELKSLEGYAIFLGGDDTVSVSTHQKEFSSLENGGISFTDDNWDLMSEDSRCGGHDRGVFNIRDGRVKVCDGYGFGRMKTSPCWIVANPW